MRSLISLSFYIYIYNFWNRRIAEEGKKSIFERENGLFKRRNEDCGGRRGDLHRHLNSPRKLEVEKQKVSGGEKSRIHFDEGISGRN